MTEVKIETAQYLATKSETLLKEQIASFHEKRSVVSAIIGINTLFVPFFLSGLQEAYPWIKLISLIPILIICVALYFFIQIYFLRELQHGIGLTKYDETIVKSHVDALLNEIALNRDSFKHNEEQLDKINNYYQKGIYSTIAAIVISIIVLSLNMFFNPPKESTKVQITNFKEMSNNNSDNNNNSGSGNGNTPTTTTTTTTTSPIPASTSTSDRQVIKEGKENK